MAFACAVAAASSRSTFAFQLFEEVFQNVACQKTCALPPQRAKKALISLHVYDPLVQKQAPKTGLLPKETESGILDDEGHAGVEVSPTQAGASASSSVPELHPLESDAVEPRYAARMIWRPQRALRRDLLDPRVRRARRGEHTPQDLLVAGVARDAGQNLPGAKVPARAKHPVEEVNELLLANKLIAHFPRPTETIVVPSPVQRAGGEAVPFPWTIIPSRAFSQPSHHVRRAGVSSDQLATKDAAFSYR